MRSRNYKYYKATTTAWIYPIGEMTFTRIFSKRRTMTGKWNVKYYDKFRRIWTPCRMKYLAECAGVEITAKEAKRIYRLIPL